MSSPYQLREDAWNAYLLASTAWSHAYKDANELFRRRWETFDAYGVSERYAAADREWRGAIVVHDIASRNRQITRRAYEIASLQLRYSYER